MKNYIRFNKGLQSRLYWFNIGEGAKLNLLEAELPILCFVWNIYLEDPSVISGDIKKLEESIFNPSEIEVHENSML